MTSSEPLAAAGKTIVALSGGVDSSVAALELLEAGHELEALFMKNWRDDEFGDCPWQEDVQDALSVCDALGIRLNTVDLTETYRRDVFTGFLAEYRAGRTPNPDVICNRDIKFRAFVDHAAAAGGTRIATGHYARIVETDSGYLLSRGADPDKDQSYFLYMLDQAQLARAVFPVGDLLKRDVRERARRAGLPTHDKKDSTGICFIGERDFRDFLRRYLPASPGEIHTQHGETIGRHPGAVYFTLGQREGLNIGGVRGYPEAPWYVIGRDLEHNVVIVGQGHDHPALMSTEIAADNLHWVAGSPPGEAFGCTARIRYRQADQACTVRVEGNARCRVTFARAQRAAMPGQSVVFYRDTVCLGGGIIAAPSCVDRSSAGA